MWVTLAAFYMLARWLRLSKAGAVRHGIYAGDPFTDATALSDAGAEVFHHMRDVNALVGLN